MKRSADRAFVFDMDGVLIDSEPLWRRAEIEIFGSVGLELSEADCFETQGMRIDEAVAYWFARSPWPGASISKVAEHIVDRMVELIEAEGEPMLGVAAALEAADGAGWRIALASSSSMRLIDTVLDRFGIRETFEVVRSAEDEARGKPHPDVYLATLRALGLDGCAAVAIEDSVNGMASALAAGMRCVAVPAPEMRDDPRFAPADWRLDSLLGFVEALPEIETAQPTRPNRRD